MLLTMLSCLFILAVIDKSTNNQSSWISYEGQVFLPQDQVKLIMLGLRRCVSSSEDTRLAVSSLVDQFNRANFSKPYDCCSSYESLHQKILAIHNMSEAAREASSKQNDTLRDILQVVEEGRENSSKVNVRVTRVESKVDTIAAKQDELKETVEDLRSQLGALLKLRNQEMEGLKVRETVIKEKEESHQREAEKIQEREEELKKMELDLKTREIDAKMQLESARKKEEDNERRRKEIATKEEQLSEEQKKIHQKKEKLEESKMLLSNIAMLMGVLGVVVAISVACCSRQSSFPRLQERQTAKFDVCHLSLTRERRLFFERTVQPRFEDLHLQASVEYCLLKQPSDFNDIPRAKTFIVHWASQRRSIFSPNWTHRGLLRALGQKPYFVMVCDQEQTEALPENVVYDSSFSQIQSEPELKEACAANCLITYRRGQNLNRTQEQVLANWMNANLGEGALAVS